jgi:hypothetical protein
MTLEDLFPESFPYMKEASYPLYRALKKEHPGKTDLQVLEWLQQLHQGVRPEGWSMQDVRSLFQSAITIRRNEGIAPAGIVLDLAEALDAMGATNDGIDLLSSLIDSLSADLMRSKFLARLGKYTEARSLVLDCQQRSPGSLEVYQWASELFAELGDHLSGRVIEPQPDPDVARLIEVRADHHPAQLQHGLIDRHVDVEHRLGLDLVGVGHETGLAARNEGCAKLAHRLKSDAALDGCHDSPLGMMMTRSGEPSPDIPGLKLDRASLL